MYATKLYRYSLAVSHKGQMLPYEAGKSCQDVLMGLTFKELMKKKNVLLGFGSENRYISKGQD